jgi:hypothetical protein
LVAQVQEALLAEKLEEPLEEPGLQLRGVALQCPEELLLVHLEAAMRLRVFCGWSQKLTHPNLEV